MITQEIVREFLDYDSDTGKLTWKRRDRKWFSSENSFSVWNSRFSEKEAFTAISNRGYFQGRIIDTTYLKHRVIWFWMTGNWPKEQINHINHDRLDNRWYNLREISNQGNCRNQSLRKTNKSGCIGIYFDKKYQKWKATIGKNIHLGYFNLLEDAVNARKEAEVKYGFHFNHGK